MAAARLNFSPFPVTTHTKNGLNKSTLIHTKEIETPDGLNKVWVRVPWKQIGQLVWIRGGGEEYFNPPQQHTNKGTDACLEMSSISDGSY